MEVHSSPSGAARAAMPMARPMQSSEQAGGHDTSALLRALLENGPRNSRDLLADLERRGATPKQIRRAREKLGVTVQRFGFGNTMRSTWSLPDAIAGASSADAGRTVGGGRQLRRATARRSAPVSQERPAAEAPILPRPDAHVAGGLTEAEANRMAARIEAFKARGLHPDAAARLALDLVLNRDRDTVHAKGSCIECQVSHECSRVRPPQVIHQCWLRRQDTP
jgi:hypothetical protein